MAKSPSFQFYPTDFLSDKNVILMSAEEVGAYIRLLCVCWIEGDLSEDITELALIAKVTGKRFTQIWEKRIKVCFSYDDKKHKFFHKRLREEIKKQKAFRQKKSDAGKESGRKRRENKELGSEQVFDSVQTKREQKRTLQSSSSSSDVSIETSLNPNGETEVIPVNPEAHKTLENWLDEVAKCYGATRHNLAKFERWEKACMKAIGSKIDLGVFITTLKAELERNKDTPHFATPDGVLEKAQLTTIAPVSPTPKYFKAPDDWRKNDAA